MAHAPSFVRLAFALALAVALASLTSACSTDAVAPTTLGASALDRDEGESDRPFSYAVFGDLPYGVVKRADLPLLINKINADTTIERALHTGDIKSGTGEACTDAYFADIKGQFDRIANPLVYTPGDNEWTDCHKDITNNGLYTPTERLLALRRTFFPVVGRTMGINAAAVTSQAQVDVSNRAYVENVTWTRSDIVFASLNIPGSNDDLEAGVPRSRPTQPATRRRPPNGQHARGPITRGLIAPSRTRVLMRPGPLCSYFRPTCGPKVRRSAATMPT